MMHKCKLTVLKTMLNEDLAAEYSIEGLKACPIETITKEEDYEEFGFWHDEAAGCGR